jgi:hypothetical protein
MSERNRASPFLPVLSGSRRRGWRDPGRVPGRGAGTALPEPQEGHCARSANETVPPQAERRTPAFAPTPVIALCAQATHAPDDERRPRGAPPDAWSSSAAGVSQAWAVTTASRQEQHCRYVMSVANESCPPPDRRRCRRVRRPSLTSSAESAMSLTECDVSRPACAGPLLRHGRRPQHWMTVNVVPHLPGSANSPSASRRSVASSLSLSVSSSRDSSATLN